MPRGSSSPRLIYPDAALSESLAGCSIGAQLLFDRLIATADDQGRHRGGAGSVWAETFPRMRKIRESDVSKWLDELDGAGMIIRYQDDGEDLIQLRSWWNWQRLEWARPSRWAAPEGWTDAVGKRPDGGGRTSPDGSGTVRQNEKENQNEKEKKKGPVRTTSGRGRTKEGGEEETKSFREAMAANGFPPPGVDG